MNYFKNDGVVVATENAPQIQVGDAEFFVYDDEGKKGQALKTSAEVEKAMDLGENVGYEPKTKEWAKATKAEFDKYKKDEIKAAGKEAAALAKEKATPAYKANLKLQRKNAEAIAKKAAKS